MKMEAMTVEKSRETQTNEVLTHFQSKGSLTSWEAIQEYRATRLADIVFRLKKKGHNITTVMEESVNADGERKRYARYYYVR